MISTRLRNRMVNVRTYGRKACKMPLRLVTNIHKKAVVLMTAFV